MIFVKYSPLYVAVVQSFTEAVKVLLDHGADVNTHCAKVKSTLHHLRSSCCFDTAVVCCHVIKPTLPGVCMSIVLHLSTSVTAQILCRLGLLCVWHVLTCQGDNQVQQASSAPGSVGKCADIRIIGLLLSHGADPHGATPNVSNHDINSNMLPYQIWYWCRFVGHGLKCLQP